ncbi:MAG: N-acetylmuramoyl-L-alanine amidase [Firmicutes bacterium]|nr:N-acetylmuramoyl-L-alanine amidase [Bacillota bacterium]
MGKSRPRDKIILQSNALVTVLLLLLSFIFGINSPDSRALPPGNGEYKASPVDGELGGGLRRDPTSLRGKVILVDPGHGGANPGSRGVGPRPEKDNVLAVAWDLKGMLEYAGAKVIMTRDGDYSPGGPKADQLEARVRIANLSRGDVFVSIHNDWNKNSSLTGTTTYFYSPDGYHLGESLQRGVSQELSSRSLGVKWASYYVLRNTAMPAALVELGFLSNKREANLLSTRSYQTKAALGIYNGLVEYFSNRSR